MWRLHRSESKWTGDRLIVSESSWGLTGALKVFLATNTPSKHAEEGGKIVPWVFSAAC